MVPGAGADGPGRPHLWVGSPFSSNPYQAKNTVSQFNLIDFLNLYNIRSIFISYSSDVSMKPRIVFYALRDMGDALFEHFEFFRLRLNSLNNPIRI